MGVWQVLDPIMSLYTGYDDSIWEYYQTNGFPYLPCSCEDASDYIAGQSFQNQFGSFCTSIGYWCDQNPDVFPPGKKVEGNCKATYSCRDVINFNEMLGGIKYTKSETSTGLITLWPGSGTDGITNVMSSTINLVLIQKIMNYHQQKNLVKLRNKWFQMKQKVHLTNKNVALY